MEGFTKRQLGQTGLTVGRLGVAGGYGAPAKAYEIAFEKGCNYFYWSSPRKKGMGEAIRNICRNGHRDDLIIVLQTYSRSAILMEHFFRKGLAASGVESADVMLLGWYNGEPSARILERALAMQEKGLFRFLALSGHNRSLFPILAENGNFDMFHFRYNPAHRGAETDILASLDDSSRPGTVSYTATRWGQLLNPKKMPHGETPPSASDCYRFVLTNPMVDVCMCGPANVQQMEEALQTLEKGPLAAEEMARIQRIGDHVKKHSGSFW